MADLPKLPDESSSADGPRKRREIVCLGIDSIVTAPARLAAGDYVWLNGSSVTDAEIDRVGEAFDLHPLTIEDLQEFEQRAKVEDYGDYIYIVAYGATIATEDADGLTEVHIIFAPTFLITVAAEPTPALEQIVELAGKREFSRQELLHSVLDALVDSFGPLLDTFDEEIERIEELLLERNLQGREREIHDLRRRLVRIARAVHRQLESFTSIRETLRRMPGHHAEDFPYFRDVLDHLVHVADSADAMRERIAGLFELYMAALDNRQNLIMRQFTVIAGIFLPLSVITGFFGMNFTWMVEAIKSGSAFALLGVALPVGVLGLLVGLFASRGLFRE